MQKAPLKKTSIRYQVVLDRAKKAPYISQLYKPPTKVAGAAVTGAGMVVTATASPERASPAMGRPPRAHTRCLAEPWR